LFEVVLALGAGGGLAHLLHRGQQQADEDGDDGDHHQQLNQRETFPSHAILLAISGRTVASNLRAVLTGILTHAAPTDEEISMKTAAGGWTADKSNWNVAGGMPLQWSGAPGSTC